MKTFDIRLIGIIFYFCFVIDVFGQNIFGISVPLKLEPYISTIKTKAHEIVIAKSKNRNLSELIWKTNNAQLIGLNAKLDYEYINVSLGWSKIIGKGSGVMDDYDWFQAIDGYKGNGKWISPKSNKWTHWSYHDDTRVTNVEFVDAHIKGNFYKNPKYNLFALYGYKEETFKWESYGGDAIYSNKGFRNTKLKFNGNIKSIDYEQIFKYPYLGLGATYKIKLFELTSSIIGSNNVNTSDIDNHYLNNLTFKEYFKPGNMIGASIQANIQVIENAQINLTFDYTNHLTNTNGYTVIFNNQGKIGRTDNGTAGISNESYILALSLKINI